MRWAAPELLNKGAYSEKADVYSLALVMIEVCHTEYLVQGQGLPSFYADTDIYRRDSVRRPFGFQCCGRNSTGRASPTAETPSLYR